MALVVAAVVQLVLGVLLYLLGRWGRASADDLVPPRLDADEHRVRADGVALGGAVCQGLGVLLALFAVATAVAAVMGVDPTLRPQ